jgi:hypothetical protein
VRVCRASVACGAAVACEVAVALGEQEVINKMSEVKSRIIFFMETCFLLDYQFMTGGDGR